MHRIRTALGRGLSRAGGVEPGAATSFFVQGLTRKLAELFPAGAFAAALLATAEPVAAGDAFYTVPPCRVIDTRSGGSQLPAGEDDMTLSDYAFAAR